MLHDILKFTFFSGLSFGTSTGFIISLGLISSSNFIGAFSKDIAGLTSFFFSFGELFKRIFSGGGGGTVPDLPSIIFVESFEGDNWGEDITLGESEETVFWGGNNRFNIFF